MLLVYFLKSMNHFTYMSSLTTMLIYPQVSEHSILTTPQSCLHFQYLLYFCKGTYTSISNAYYFCVYVPLLSKYLFVHQFRARQSCKSTAVSTARKQVRQGPWSYRVHILVQGHKQLENQSIHQSINWKGKISDGYKW